MGDASRDDKPSSLKYLTGVRLDSLHLPSHHGVLKSVHTKPNVTAIPERYSTLDAHPQCRFFVRDQGQCGSCWAVTAVDVLTDRLCITQGVKEALSAEPLVACAGMAANGQEVMEPFTKPECLASAQGDKIWSCACDGLDTTTPPPGCSGNSMQAAWEYLKTYGTVPGLYMGPFGASVSCKTMCSMTQGFPNVFDANVLSLQNSKIPSSVPLSAQDDALHENIRAMQTDLMANGPIQGAFSVYQSFYDFFDKNPTGVYKMQPEGKPLGGHTSKIVGWDVAQDDRLGVPKGTPYWILQNTWGPKWGDKGFYKMAMTQASDLEALTKAKAFVIEYNAMASPLAMGASVKEMLSETPPTTPRRVSTPYVWFWVGLSLTAVLVIGLVIYLVVTTK